MTIVLLVGRAVIISPWVAGMLNMLRFAFVVALFSPSIVSAGAQTSTSPRNVQRSSSFGRAEQDTDLEGACRLTGTNETQAAEANTEARRAQREVQQKEQEAIAAHAKGDALGEGSAWLDAASLLYNSGNLGRALDLGRSAVAALRRANDAALLADALSALGAFYEKEERHDLALTAYREALALPSVDWNAHANTLNSLAMTYHALGRPDSALFYLDSLLRLAGLSDSSIQSDALNNVGLVHLELGSNARSAADRAQLDSAIDAFQMSLGLTSEADSGMRATTLVNIGVSHRRLFQLSGDRAQLDSALARYREAARLEIGSTDIRDLAQTCHNIALIYGDMGDALRSRAGLTAALRAHAATRDRYWHGMALAELAGSWRRQVPRDLQRATKFYDSAAVIFASIAANAGGDANRLGFAEQRMVLGVFDDWALTALHLPSNGPEAALQAAERGRAQALLHLMKQRGRLPSQAQIAFPSLSYLVTRDTLIVWLTQPTGAVHATVIPISSDSISAFVGDARAALRVQSNGSGSQRRGDLGSSETGTRPTISIDSAFRRLAGLLLPSELRPFLPVPESDLVVIPAGVLGLVPFAALPLDVDGEPLGIKYAVRYAPSFATLAVANAEASRRPDPRIYGWGHSLVVGDPIMPRAHGPDGATVTFDSLPNARAEASWLADSLHQSPLVGAEATEDSVRALMADAPLVHLATHGIAYDRDDRARASFIALASGSNDGMLTVGEILDEQRPMRASLVVLSACETALGNLKQAEGTVGFQRAFLARGASSVLVSLWNVSDEATALLMRRFYERWLFDTNYPSKAEALRSAQRDVRIKFGGDRVDLWAAFQLVGAP